MGRLDELRVRLQRYSDLLADLSDACDACDDASIRVITRELASMDLGMMLVGLGKGWRQEDPGNARTIEALLHSMLSRAERLAGYDGGTSMILRATVEFAAACVKSNCSLALKQ